VGAGVFGVMLSNSQAEQVGTTGARTTYNMVWGRDDFTCNSQFPMASKAGGTYLMEMCWTDKETIFLLTFQVKSLQNQVLLRQALK